MSRVLKASIPAMLLAIACVSDGAGDETPAAGVGMTAAPASSAVSLDSDKATAIDADAGGGASSCNGGLTQLLASKGPALTLRDIPDSAARSEFRPDLYRTLAPMFESSRLLPDGFLLPDGTALNEHVIFRAEGPTANLILLFDGHLPCPRAGCTMLAYYEDRSSKTLSRIYLGSKRTNVSVWGPPRAVFGDCGVQSLYFVDALDNKESAPDRFRSKLGDLEIVHMMATKPLDE